MSNAVANPVFDGIAWKARLAQIKAGIRSCGQVYELFAERFTEAVNEELDAMDEETRQRALAIAVLDPDYYDGDGDSGDSGTCPHGLDVWTCPAGCGG